MRRSPRFKRAVVVGLGLLGGSLALGLKKRGLAAKVVAWVRDPKAVRPALKAGFVDEIAATAQGARGADLVVLCSPYTCFEGQLKELARSAPAGCLVTDVGSVKGPDVGRWHRAAGPLAFVASHPMAGGEKTGWRNASAELFQGAVCFLTPVKGTDPRALREVSALWGALGMRVALAAPEEHDRLVARVSHLPHAVAFALARAQARGGRLADFAWAGKGWFDTSRVAGSSPDLWADIFLHHPGPMDRALAGVEADMRALRRLLREGRRAPLRAWLARAADFRAATEKARP